MSEKLLNTEKSFKHDPQYIVDNKDYDLFFSKFDQDAPIVQQIAERLKGVRADVQDPAAGFLQEAKEAMELKAKLRDTPKGERTAEQIAKVFNAITGHNLTETDAWTFLLVLKLVRSRNGKYNRDDYVDLAAYSALMGEHASSGVK